MLMATCWNQECGSIKKYTREDELYLLFYVTEFKCHECGMINVISDDLKQYLKLDWGIK